MPAQPFGHAIVIGGSITGLLTARVLADHFARVTLLERDHLPETPSERNGVPQGKHLHVLLSAGQQIIEKLFPGLSKDFEAHGVPYLEWGQDSGSFTRLGTWSRQFHSGLFTYSPSRPLVEWLIRQRLTKLANITIQDGKQVTELTTAPDKTTVTGVTIRLRGGSGDETETLSADLVVDASGRTSRAPEWLSELGYPAVKDSVVNSFLGYASRWYKTPTNTPQQWKSLLVNSQPPRLNRAGVIMQVEGGYSILTMAGSNKDYPPTDEEGFLEFARNLANPILYETVKDAEPASAIYGYQRTANRWRHFEQLERWPERFVVIGDAACAFNPVYGQGMTTAALGAQALDQLLRATTDQLDGLAKRFQTRLAEVNQTTWLMATSEDFLVPNTEGERPPSNAQFVQNYLQAVINAAEADDNVGRQFIKVVNLLEKPTSLFRPDIALRVLWVTLRRRLRG